MASADELLVQMLNLPLRERGRIIRDAIASLDDAPADPGAEEAWGAEADARANEILLDEVELLDGDKVVAGLRAELESGLVGQVSATSRRSGRPHGRGHVVPGTRRPRR